MSNYKKLGDLIDTTSKQQTQQQTQQTQQNSELPLQLNTIEDKQHVIHNNRIVLIDVFAEWCNPCKQIASRYQNIATKFTSPGLIQVVKENIDDKIDRSNSDYPDIKGIPAFEYYVDGSFVEMLVGADIKKVEEKLVEIINKVKMSKA